MKYTYTKENLEKAIKESLSIAEVCRKLKIRPVGGNYKTLHSKIKEHNLDTSHFTGAAWNKGLKFKPNPPKKLEEILTKDSTYSSNNLRLRLIKEGLKEEKCEICKNSTWLENPIKLELHHIDGNNTNNLLENLQILCPNCHSFTDNFRGSKKGLSALSEKKEVEYRKFKETLTDNADGNLEPSLDIKEGAETRHDIPKSKKQKIRKLCPVCNKEMPNRNKYCSVECYQEDNKGIRPDVFSLIEAFKKYKSFVKVGEYYNVTDNAVRKWCKIYGILDKVKE